MTTMAHHTTEHPFKSEKEQVEDVERFAEALGLGPTGEYPHGELGDNDEGELKFALANGAGRVIIDFGAPVRSVGFTPEQAKKVGGLLINHARKAAKQDDRG